MYMYDYLYAWSGFDPAMVQYVYINKSNAAIIIILY